MIFQTTCQFFFKFYSSVSWNILLCTFLGQTLYPLHKRDQSKCKFFRHFSTQIKIHQVLVIFETKNKFLFKFCTTLILRIGVSTPHPSKTPTPLSCHVPPLNQQIVQAQALPFQAIPPLNWFFMNLPLKVRSFSEPPRYRSFLSLIPSYLLKVTKFLGKVSQF